MNRRIRLMSLTLVAASTSVLAACNDEPAAEPSSTTEQTATTAGASTTSSTTTSAPPATAPTASTVAPTTGATTAPHTSPPTIAPDDWEAILEELGRRRVALYAAPDVARIGEYCAPGTDCATLLETQLGDAIARGLHIEGQQPFDVIAIEQALVSDEPPPAPQVANLIVVIGPEPPPPARLVDAAGNVVDEFELNTTESRGSFTLASWESDPSLPWRVVQAETLPPQS